MYVRDRQVQRYFMLRHRSPGYPFIMICVRKYFLSDIAYRICFRCRWEYNIASFRLKDPASVLSAAAAALRDEIEFGTSRFTKLIYLTLLATRLYVSSTILTNVTTAIQMLYLNWTKIIWCVCVLNLLIICRRRKNTVLTQNLMTI